jgi:uncharacterized membrane protein YfcA
MNIVVVSIIIFVIAVTMTMTGRGGGNFYVLALVAAGQAMHQAATSAQFILMLTAFAGMLVFQKNKTVDWKLALVIDPPTDIMAFIGGYFSGYASNVSLKLLLAWLLMLAVFSCSLKSKNGQFMLQRNSAIASNFSRTELCRNLWYALPVTALAGLAAGAVRNFMRLV